MTRKYKARLFKEGDKMWVKIADGQGSIFEAVPVIQLQQGKADNIYRQNLVDVEVMLHTSGFAVAEIIQILLLKKLFEDFYEQEY